MSELGEMLIPEGRNPSRTAIMDCAKAMSYFLKLGFREQDIPTLERLWWEVRDDRGNVREKET